MTSNSQNSSPVDTVKAFIACVKMKDLELMRKMIHPEATACLIRENEPRFLPLAEAINALTNAQQEYVEVSRDEVQHADGDYATVWTSFSTYRDGEVSIPFALMLARHCLLIRLAASSFRFELILLLEKPSFGLNYPDEIRYCKIVK
jgi:hypothetical protein